METNIKPNKLDKGFTLIELMVVVSIMIVLITMIVININGQRSSRDLKIAQAQLVSNIRKVTSYTLAARTLASGKSAQYYLIKIDFSKPTQYTIEAISDASSSPKVETVETINLPTNIRFASTSPISITGRLASPATQVINQTCILASFSAPYNKVVFNDGCNLPNAPNVNLANAADDYGKIINFQTNVSCLVNTPASPASCTASTDSIMTITLTDRGNTLSKTVQINSITGGVTFN